MNELRQLEDPLAQVAAPDADLSGKLRPLEDPIAAVQEVGKPVVEKDSDLIGSALRGFKQSIAPHLLTKNDIKGVHTGLDQVTEAGASMFADVAVDQQIGEAA